MKYQKGKSNCSTSQGVISVFQLHLLPLFFSFFFNFHNPKDSEGRFFVSSASSSGVSFGRTNAGHRVSKTSKELLLHCSQFSQSSSLLVYFFFFLSSFPFLVIYDQSLWFLVSIFFVFDRPSSVKSKFLLLTSVRFSMILWICDRQNFAKLSVFFSEPSWKGFLSFFLSFSELH